MQQRNLYWNIHNLGGVVTESKLTVKWQTCTDTETSQQIICPLYCTAPDFLDS